MSARDSQTKFKNARHSRHKYRDILRKTKRSEEDKTTIKSSPNRNFLSLAVLTFTHMSPRRPDRETYFRLVGRVLLIFLITCFLFPSNSSFWRTIAILISAMGGLIDLYGHKTVYGSQSKPMIKPLTIKKPTTFHRFGDLPEDLVLSIAAFLPLRTIVSLSITCKDLYRNQALRRIWAKGFDAHKSDCDCSGSGYRCYIGLENIGNHERLMFLKKLQPSVPGWLLCDFCQKFHPQPQGPVTSTDRDKWGTCSKVLTPAIWLACSRHYVYLDYRLQFEDAQMVMNRFRWGEAHGAPLESISRNTAWMPMENDRHIFMAKINVEPRIVSDMLMLHTRQRILFTQRTLEALGKDRFFRIPEMLQLATNICGNADSTHLLWLEACGMELMLDEHVNQGTDEVSIRHSKVFCCSLCLTEYTVSIISHRHAGVQTGFEISLQTWTNLGRCEHTFDPAWLAAAWHAGDFYSDQSIQQARQLIGRTRGYVSAHSADWVSASCSTDIDNSLLQAWDKLAVEDLLPTPPAPKMASGQMKLVVKKARWLAGKVLGTPRILRSNRKEQRERTEEL